MSGVEGRILAPLDLLLLCTTTTVGPNNQCLPKTLTNRGMKVDISCLLSFVLLFVTFIRHLQYSFKGMSVVLFVDKGIVVGAGFILKVHKIK